MAERLVIVGLGDSTTAGTPAFLSPAEMPPNGRGNPESQYAYWMAELHPDWTVLNRGINGQRSDEILARFTRDVLAVRPDYVILLAGVNDIYQGISIEFVEGNLDVMYRLSLDAGVVPVAASVLPYNLHRQSLWERLSKKRPPKSAVAIRELNARIAATARTVGLPFCDTNLAVRDPGDPDRLAASPDGLHPDVTGYRAMGDALAATIARHLAYRSRA